MITFRKALKDDSIKLSNLAFESEKYLGYDSDYMSKFSALYNVTDEFIDKYPVYIMEDNGKTLGFWGLIHSENNWELDLFYISKEYIGKGYGQILWNQLVTECRERGITEFQLVTSPQSAGFYEKMGAVVVDQVESLIVKGRMVPRIKYNVL